MGETEVNVGVLLAHTPGADPDRLKAFARRMADDARGVLEEGTGAVWIFHLEEPVRLSDDEPRRPTDFLDEATTRMVEGPFDVLLVMTDAPLTSRRHRTVAALASRVGRVVVVSTRKLLTTPRGRPVRTLAGPEVRWNAAALLVHQMGHVMGLDPARDPDDAVAPFAFRDDRRTVPRFGASRERLREQVRTLPQREHHLKGPLRSFAFHLASALRHPGQTLRPLLRNRAPLLPLALPGLATAAVAPSLILVFTAEIWDVGLNLTDRVSWSFTVLSILAATIYLTVVQDLFFPHREKRVVTEHVAVVNVTIFLTMLLAAIGLWGMVGLLMLFVETYIFPPGLISTWPTLQDPEVTWVDKVRLASFISTVGVLTGALAGGLESRTVIRHLALFRDQP